VVSSITGCRNIPSSCHFSSMTAISRKTCHAALLCNVSSSRMITVLWIGAFGIVRTCALLPFTTTYYHQHALNFPRREQLRQKDNSVLLGWGDKQHLLQAKKKRRSLLFGIAEWRDTVRNPTPGIQQRPIVSATTSGSAAKVLGNKDGSYALPREICVLPFSYEECLVQGQTKEIRLYEDRFLKLFDYCTTHHSGVVAMGLLADKGIIQTVPLCEIETFSRIEGFGIFATLRVVGRASLLELTQQEPYIRGLGVEISDTMPPNLEFPNLIASNIENIMITLASLEHKLSTDMLQRFYDDDDDDDMKRRIIDAKLEDVFYYNDSDDDEEYYEYYDSFNEDEEGIHQFNLVDRGEDDGDTNGESEFFLNDDINGQFQFAFHQALNSDTQGYTIMACGTASSPPSTLLDEGDNTNNNKRQRKNSFLSPSEKLRSVQHLTALSWSAFCIAPMDVTYKLQALDCDDLFDRLKLAAYALRELRSKLEAKVALLGIDSTTNSRSSSSPSSSTRTDTTPRNNYEDAYEDDDDTNENDDDFFYLR